MNKLEVPSPIDFKNLVDAQEWERTAQSRPGRSEIFKAFATQLMTIPGTHPNVLELGSGPGFLASYLLQEMPHIQMNLLDFSAAMHTLAKKRLGKDAGRVHFIERDLKDPNWEKDLVTYDAVITNQAVHELRHKKYAVGLHIKVKALLRPGGIYLVSDHFFGEGGLKNDQLYMTVEEQQESLLKAGFSSVRLIVAAGSLVMHYAM